MGLTSAFCESAGKVLSTRYCPPGARFDHTCDDCPSQEPGSPHHGVLVDDEVTLVQIEGPAARRPGAQARHGAGNVLQVPREILATEGLDRADRAEPCLARSVPQDVHCL